MPLLRNRSALPSVALFASIGLGPFLVALMSCASSSRPQPAPVATPSTAAGVSSAADPRSTASPAGSSAGVLASASPSTGSAPVESSGAPTEPCPADMVDVQVACIDRYEAPNQAGAKPLLMQSLADAEGWCKVRGKRLCTEDEWVRACQGPQGFTYPYGEKYQEHHCNQDGKFVSPSWGKLAQWPGEAAKAEAQRLDQSEPAGQRSTCMSEEGVYDLTGNAGEWVVRTRADPEACQTPEQKAHRYVVKGCFWGKCFRVPHEPSCEYVNCAHDEGFRSYEFGARCCLDRAGGSAAPAE